MKNNFKKAFSLIEISMVILIVGILIAGISKGIDMVYDMRLATARALTDKAPMFGMENLEMWLETTSENSLATGTTSFTNVANPPDKKEIGRWNDINPTLINPNNKNHAVQGTLGYQPLYIQDGINGLKISKDDVSQIPSLIAQAILRLNDDQELVKSITSIARTQLFEKYSSEVVSQKLYKICEKIIDQK